MDLGTFTLYSCSDGKEIYKKSVMHVQSCCLADLNPLLFFDVLVALAVGDAYWKGSYFVVTAMV